MALRSGKKKMSRKLKRTIRKTLSGICLASALVVALIPAAPARAKVDPVYTTANVSYDYGVQDADETDLTVLDTNLSGIELDVNNVSPAPTIYETKTVTKLSDGSYEIMWQFKVYTIGGRGIICEYNSLYNKGELEIKASLPLDYMVVETDFYDAFYAAHTAAKTASNNNATIQRNPGSATPTATVKSNYHLSTIESSPALGSDQDVVATYWPTEFNNYKTSYEQWKAADDAYNDYLTEQAAWQAKSDAWNAYVTAHEAWATGADPDPATEPQPGPGVTQPGQPPTPVAPAGSAPERDFWVADMILENKQKFFLEGQPYYNEELGGVAMARTYTLTSVIDSRNGAQTPQQFIWMPQGEPNAAANHNRVNDSLGFVGSSWTAILGIGDRAFANTSNVTNLKLAGELKYIGDEAFANSFVESINFDNVEDIGNRAYKNCTKLKNITLSDATVNIGTEAFYGCNSLTSVALPQSISYIGPGAFADCTALSTLDLSAINQSNCDIDDFAFYDCIALSNVTFSDKINRIGNAAFAVNKGVTGTLTNFTFPDHITGSHSCKIHTASGGVNGIGNFVLAGRTNLRTVTMPADYGRTSAVTLPCGVFYNCINLQSVTFPNDGGGSCGNVSFEKVGTGADQRTVFDTIQTQEFRVYGPATNSAGQIASPRKSTWGLKSGLGNDIPYIYTDTTGEHVELSQGDYIFIIDDKGVLLSCVYADPQNVPATIDTMTIPTYVGDTKVTGISSNCFATQEAQELLDRVKNLVFKDDTISEIAANAFSGCDLLETVTIGNSVTKIGDSAFANCPNLTRVNIGSGVTEIGTGAFKNCNRLTYVKFDSPKGGFSSFPLEGIGAEAFSTGASKLTFEGGIDEEYGPFKWAMQLDNYVDERNGTRVCYTTGFPDFQTVIVDNRNGLPTLVDYVHYDQIDAISTSLGLNPAETVHSLTERYNKLGVEELDASGNVSYTYSINNDETKLVNAALHLVVPSGVKSIDVNGFMNNTSPLAEGFSSVASNSYNVSTYLLAGPYYAAYKSPTPTDINGGGLFKNYYGTETGDTGNKREYPNNDEGKKFEKEDIGNDRLLSVKLGNVEYLPDYAFYSCENLADINLGSALTTMGDAPFTGCTSLTGIGSNTDNFKCQNGIVYSENPDGTYNIVEVLSTRGVKVGSKKIAVSEADPYLANVSNILDGAFENCDGITNVDFTGMTLLKSVPDNCFRDCDLLNQVVLPETVSIIGHNAFAGCMEGIELVCYSKEVFLPFDAFGTSAGNNKVESKRVISYSDSAARKSGADLGADVTEVLDDKVKVRFVDYDYVTPLSKDIMVVKGGSLSLQDIPDDPTREGYKFTGWKPDIKSTFNEDTTIVATYELNSNNQGGNGEGGNGGNGGNGSSSESGNNQGGNGSGSTSPTLYTLTVTNGNGSGSYAAGATVIITCTNPPSGYVFDKWKPTTDDLGIASVNVAATTLKMPAHEASVEATFKKAPSNTSGSGSSNSGNNGSNSGTVKNGNSVVISKPGISNTDLASARVSGSTDNYVIRIAETAAATAAVEKALTKEYGSLDGIRYSAMDITLYDSTGSTRITDYSGLSITVKIPIPDTMTQYAGNNKVAGVVNEKLDKLKPKFTTIDGVPCIEFTATHFSPYTIYVDTGNIVEGTSDETPKTGDLNPKWFLVFGLAALGIALFFIKDKKPLTERPALG